VKITNVSSEFLVFPIPVPVRETSRDCGVLLVTVETDTGLLGTGVARTYDFQGVATQQVIRSQTAPFLTDRSCFVLPGELWHSASFDFLEADYRAPTGVLSSAMSGVDQALWDIWGQSLGEPVYRLLGGAKDEVEAYMTCGLSVYTPEEEAEAARLFLRAGFRTFKLQGADDHGRDVASAIARVKRLREAVGGDAQIIFDGHNNFRLYEAIELAKGIEPYNVAFLDEPLFARDPVAMRRLRDTCPRVPLAGRSRGGSAIDNRDMILAGGVDVMASNVMDQGGFTQSLKIAHTAELHQIPLVTGGAFHMQNAHLIAGVSNGWMTEYHVMWSILSETMFVDPIVPKDGVIKMSGRPGLGLVLNEAAVAEGRGRAEAAYRARFE
jgi:L-rhamnonate dehydratase